MEKNIKVKIEGMHCQACEKLVVMELEEIGAKNIAISVKGNGGSFSVPADVSVEKIKQAVKNAGYPFEILKED